MGAVGAMGQAAMVIFLACFLLLRGDLFKRKLVRTTGPSLSRRKVTVHILDDINGSIQQYMLMLLTTNLVIGLLSWAVFRWPNCSGTESARPGSQPHMSASRRLRRASAARRTSRAIPDRVSTKLELPCPG